jgi:acyl-coenzyme A thioesterase 13
MTPPGESYLDHYRAVTTSADFENASPEDRIQAILAIRTPHDRRLTTQFMEEDVKLLSFTKLSNSTCSAVFTFKVERFYCNISGNLHGGAQALFYDMLTSFAMQAIGVRGFWLNGGVSRTLEVTYLRPAPEGTELLCEVEVMSTGKSLSFHRGVMKRADNGAIISVGKHDKAAVTTKPGYDSPPKL